jgi:hypothetical protein
MSVDYFWALSLRCSKAASDTFDLQAQRELRQLAEEFSARAHQLEGVAPPPVQGHSSQGERGGERKSKLDLPR